MIKVEGREEGAGEASKVEFFFFRTYIKMRCKRDELVGEGERRDYEHSLAQRGGGSS